MCKNCSTTEYVLFKRETMKKIKKGFLEQQKDEATQKREKEDQGESFIFGTMPRKDDQVFMMDEMKHVKKRKREELKEAERRMKEEKKELETKRRRSKAKKARESKDKDFIGESRKYTMLHFAAELFDGQKEGKLCAEIFEGLLGTFIYFILFYCILFSS